MSINRISYERTPDVFEIEERKNYLHRVGRLVEDERVEELSENWDYENRPSRSSIIASCNDEFFYDDYESSCFGSNDLSWNQEHMF